MARELTKERDQRTDLTVWGELLDLSCRYDILPIDLLATVYSDCKDSIIERMDLLYGYKKGESNWGVTRITGKTKAPTPGLPEI